MKKDRITEEKLNKYYKLSIKALEIAKNSILKKTEAEEIILMVECYLSDSVYFREKGDYINSFACLNYAHGWLDAGSRLKIFRVNDRNLFTI